MLCNCTSVFCQNEQETILFYAWSAPLTPARSGGKVREEALTKGQKIFQKSDESAYSIVPSRASRSIRDDVSLLSFETEKSLVYQELSIDDDLFTARVYKRNYRSPIISSLLRRAKTLLSKSHEVHNRLSIHSVENTEGVKRHNGIDPESTNKQTDLDDSRLCLKDDTPSPVKSLPDCVVSEWFVGHQMTEVIPGPVFTDSLSYEKTMLPARIHRRDGSRCLDLGLAFIRLYFARVFTAIISHAKQIPTVWLQHCLMTASILGDKEDVKLVLRRMEQQVVSCRLQQTSKQLYSDDNPIDLAFRYHSLDIVKLLLQHAPIVPVDMRLTSAPGLIHIAINEKNEAMLLLLMKYNVNVHHNYSDSYGRYDHQAIHVACQSGSPGCVAILVKAGARLDAVDRHGRTARQYLNTTESTSLIQSSGTSRSPLSKALPLLPNVFDPSPDQNLLSAAAETTFTSDPSAQIIWERPKWQVGQVAIAQVYGPELPNHVAANLFRGFPVNDSCISLRYHIANGNPRFLANLLAQGRSFPRVWLEHALMTACRENRMDVVNLILKHVDMVSLSTLQREVGKYYWYNNPIDLAIRLGHMSITTLLSRGPQSIEDLVSSHIRLGTQAGRHHPKSYLGFPSQVPVGQVDFEKPLAIQNIAKGMRGEPQVRASKPAIMDLPQDHFPDHVPHAF